ncbi:flagellar motor switch phosphatase FliY [Thermincola ferriacetica]
MSDGVLSQEEIDALLRSDAFQEAINASEPDTHQAAAGPTGDELTNMEKDAVGEVANMVMGSAATALSTLLGKKVEITTPVVEITTPARLRHEYPLPYLLVNVEYVTGIKGSNVLIIKDGDAGVIVDLMMMGDGTSPPAQLEEMHLSAIAEAMNQMMGSASTAFSTIIKERVEISPPTVDLINLATDELKGRLANPDEPIVKVSFKMTIEDLVNSEMMQLMPLDFARELVGRLMDDMKAPHAEAAATAAAKTQAPTNAGYMEQLAAAPQPNAPLQSIAQDTGNAQYQLGGFTGGGNVKPANSVPVQPAQFAPLNMGFEPKTPSTIDLIMDVPLQITVELGKAKKTIREILNLAPGSVVELDKLAGEPVDLMVNGKLLAKGEVVVIDENFGIRITDIVSPMERVTNLQ